MSCALFRLPVDRRVTKTFFELIGLDSFIRLSKSYLAFYRISSFIVSRTDDAAEQQHSAG